MTPVKSPGIRQYQDILLKYNKKVNLISRKITEKQLEGLIKDSISMGKLIRGKTVVDMGSGNGILGLVMAIADPKKLFVLLDSNWKKVEFLEYAVKKLKLDNVKVEQKDVINFLRARSYRSLSIITRGFTGKPVFQHIMNNKRVVELMLITSQRKIDIIKESMDKYKETVYNIESRDIIKILKLENVSRETKSQKM